MCDILSLFVQDANMLVTTAKSGLVLAAMYKRLLTILQYIACRPSSNASESALFVNFVSSIGLHTGLDHSIPISCSSLTTKCSWHIVIKASLFYVISKTRNRVGFPKSLTPYLLLSLFTVSNVSPSR